MNLFLVINAKGSLTSFSHKKMSYTFWKEWMRAPLEEEDHRKLVINQYKYFPLERSLIPFPKLEHP